MFGIKEIEAFLCGHGINSMATAAQIKYSECLSVKGSDNIKYKCSCTQKNAQLPAIPKTERIAHGLLRRRRFWVVCRLLIKNVSLNEQRKQRWIAWPAIAMLKMRLVHEPRSDQISVWQPTFYCYSLSHFTMNYRPIVYVNICIMLRLFRTPALDSRVNRTHRNYMAAITWTNKPLQTNVGCACVPLLCAGNCRMSAK